MRKNSFVEEVEGLTVNVIPDSSLFFLGDNIAGNVTLNIQKKSLMVQSITLGLIGHLELKNHPTEVFYSQYLSIKRHSFYFSSILFHDGLDGDGFYRANEGISCFSFSIASPQNLHLPSSCFIFENNSIKYFIVAHMNLALENKKFVFKIKKEICLLQTPLNLFSQKILSSTEMWGLLSPGMVKVQAQLSSTLIPSGGIGFVDISIENPSSKDAKKIKVLLVQDITSGSSFLNKRKLLLNECKNEVDCKLKGSYVQCRIPFVIPQSISSVCMKSLILSYKIEIRITAPYCKDIVITLPIEICHPASKRRFDQRLSIIARKISLEIAAVDCRITRRINSSETILAGGT